MHAIKFTAALWSQQWNLLLEVPAEKSSINFLKLMGKNFFDPMSTNKFDSKHLEPFATL